MDRRLELDNDPGFFPLVLNNTEKQLDIFEQNNVIYDLKKANEGDLVAFQKAVADHLGKLFGMETPPSTAMAVRFETHVYNLVEDVKKKLAGPQSSPSTSPESTPSPSSDGNEQP